MLFSEELTGCAGVATYFNWTYSIKRGNGNCKDEKWKLVRCYSYSWYTDSSFIPTTPLSQILSLDH